MLIKKPSNKLTTQNSKVSSTISSILIMVCVMALVYGCGGKSGGSSKIDTTTPTYVGSFVATADNKIEGGQLEFAFGQTATFWGNNVDNETWLATSGTVNSSGQYFTPKDLNLIVDDKVTMTFKGSADTDSRTISLSPFPSYIESSQTYQYLNGNQKYSVRDLTNAQAIGVASFKNLGADISLSDVIANTEKKQQPVSDRMAKLMATDSRYKAKKNRDKFLHQKRTNEEKQKSKKIVKSNRASDALGTRDVFFVSENKTPGQTQFEKIYSGSKCLIYSEVNANNDAPFVDQARGKIIGDAFEVANPFHPTKKAIFDVVTDFFGNPWGIDKNGQKINDGGRDGEEQVVLLLFDGFDDGLYGYMDPIDEEEQGFFDPFDPSYISNGAEIVYLNVYWANDDISIFATAAHEFQHLCDFNQTSAVNGTFPAPNVPADFDLFNTPVLFNEGQSVLSEELNGFGMSMSGNLGNEFIFQTADIYISTISENVFTFYDFNGGIDYGKGYLFWRYIYDTYGESVLKASTQSHLVQPFSVEFATGKKMDVLIQEFVLAILQTDSSQPIQSKIKISTIDRSKEYFDTTGVSVGQFAPIDYISGFSESVIKSTDVYVFRLYKLLPTNGEVSFTLDNITRSSNFSIFTAIINQ